MLKKLMIYPIGRWCLTAGWLIALCAVPAWAQVTIPAGATIDIPTNAAMDLGCTPLQVQGTLNVQASQINAAAGVTIQSSGVLNGGSGTVQVSGDWVNYGNFVPGTSSVLLSDNCTTTPVQLLGNTTFYNLTLQSSNGHLFVIPEGAHIHVEGQLVLTGTAGNPVVLASGGSGTATITLGPSASVVTTFATVPPSVHIGAPVRGVPTLSGALMALTACLMAVTAGLRRRLRATHSAPSSPLSTPLQV